jgi:hypothetical protein
MNTLRALRRSLPALLLSVLTVCVPPALGQGTKPQDLPLRPPNPSTPDQPPVIWNFLVIVLVVGLAGYAALIPSKRGHQD